MATEFPQRPPGSLTDANAAMAAAMYAGFNAGLLAAKKAQGSPEPASRTTGRTGRPTRESALHRSQMDTKPQRGLPQKIAPSRMQFSESKMQQATPRDFHCNASEVSTTVSTSSLHECRSPCRSPSPEVHRSPCHLIWCDQRAFKEASTPWKELLEKETGETVKGHKTAENCIRLLRKKQHSQARPPCVFLVSWANAPTLLPYLSQSPHVTAKVILLCDMCRGRSRDDAEKLAAAYPFVTHVAACWTDALAAASKAVAEFRCK